MLSSLAITFLLIGVSHVNRVTHPITIGREFTPKLATFYKEANTATVKNLEIVFISADKDASEFKEYIASMPWKATPFGDARNKELETKYNVTGIPKLVITRPDGFVVTEKGRADVGTKGAKAAIEEWAKVK